MKVSVVDKKGEKIEELELPGLTGVVFNPQAISKYVRVFLSGQRQGNAKVKTKAEVSGGGRKPWKQKGTGRARQGSNRSPQWVHGGVVHGPAPKDWAKNISSAEKRNVLAMVLEQKNRDKDLTVLDKVAVSKTKEANDLLTNFKLEGKRVCVVLDSTNFGQGKYFRNISFVTIASVKNLNSYSLLNSGKAIFTKLALQELGFAK